MERRNFIKTVGTLTTVGIAGCISPDKSSGQTSSIQDISSIKLDTNQPNNVSYTVSFLNRSSTEEQPIAFELTFTNVLDESLTISNAPNLLFEYATDTSNKFMLLSDSYSSASRENNCWSIPPAALDKKSDEVVELKPEESVSKDLYLVSYKGCDETDYESIRFKSTYYIHNSATLSEGEILNAVLTVN